MPYSYVWTNAIAGTINMLGATINTSETMIIDLNGTVNALGVEMINGDVGIVNEGIINVGSLVVGPGSLTMGTGSLTVGASGPDLPSTGGTLNLYPASVLTLAAGSSGVFTVKGDVNMYGAGIASDVDIRSAPAGQSQGRLNSLAGPNGFDIVGGNVTAGGTLNVGTATTVSELVVSGAVSVPGQLNVHQASIFEPLSLTVSGALDMYGGWVAMGGSTLNLSGTLTSHGGSAGEDDLITASLLNHTGTIRYLDLVHILALTGDYTQGTSATLDMRISASSNDWFSVGGTATLARTLRVTGLGPLPAATTWTLLTAATVVPAFTDAILPPGLLDLYDANNVYVGLLHNN